MSGQLRLQLPLVDVAVVVLMDHDHVGDRLAPGELVRVVLVRTDEDDRSVRRGNHSGQVVAVVEVGRDA